MTAGKFCWHDLLSTDPDSSREFFTKLFGWTVSPMDMGEMGTYQMLMNGEEGIGGIVPLEENVPVPSHWIGYVTVDDVDAALEGGTNHGGRTCVPGTDIPNVGRFGVLTDPTGAVLSPFASAHDAPEEGGGESPPNVGSFCWNEILTNDVDAVKSFYSEVFGWTTVDHDMGEKGVYTMFLQEGKDRAGAMTLPPDAQGAPPHWLSYVLVEDVDAKAAEIEPLGGTLHCPPMDVPGIGRFAVGADPTGATFAIWKNVKHDWGRARLPSGASGRAGEMRRAAPWDRPPVLCLDPKPGVRLRPGFRPDFSGHYPRITSFPEGGFLPRGGHHRHLECGGRPPGGDPPAAARCLDRPSGLACPVRGVRGLPDRRARPRDPLKGNVTDAGAPGCKDRSQRCPSSAPRSCCPARARTCSRSSPTR